MLLGRILRLGLVAASVAGPGCAAERLTTPPPAAHAALSNPLFVPVANGQYVWERVAEVLHRHQFPIAVENKPDGVIETEYKTGSGVLEPWHHDSVGLENRWESTLQSVRRRVLVTLAPSSGGHLVGVEVYRELEDLHGLAANSAGGATFQESTPLRRDLNLVVGQSAPSGWIPQGRDPDLEHRLLTDIQRAL